MGEGTCSSSSKGQQCRGSGGHNARGRAPRSWALSPEPSLAATQTNKVSRIQMPRHSRHRGPGTCAPVSRGKAIRRRQP